MIIIFGMHRSGTSALAGMLHSAGISLGEVFMTPLPENPKGFFEDLRIQGVNKKIIKSIGKEWNDVPTIKDLQQVPKQVLQLIPQVYDYFRTQFKTWAWKDPRLCLTFPLWAKILPLEEVHVLFIVRHPMSVAISLQTRNQMPIEEGLELWRTYNLRITELLQSYQLPYTFVRYELLIKTPSEVQKILEHNMGVSMKDAWRFIDVKLNRSEKKNPILPKKIQKTYDYLLKEWDNTSRDLSFETKKVLKQGEDYYVAGNLEVAKECFEKVLENDLNHIEALNNLGVIAFNQGFFENATLYFHKALEINSEYIEAIENLAKCMEAMGKFSNALEQFERRIKFGYIDTNILNSMGNCLMQVGDLNNAYKRYKESLQIDSDQVIIHQIVEGLEVFDRTHEEKNTYRKLSSPSGIKLKKNSTIGNCRFQIIAFSDFETDAERKLRWGDYWVKKELEQEFEKLGYTICDKNPDIILHLFGVPVSNLPEEPYKIIWIHSHPDLVSSEILEQYEKIYCQSPTYLEKIKKWGFKPELLVGGTAKKPVKTNPRYDLVFVGNTKGHFGRKIIKDLGNIKHELKVWGEGWDRILTPEQYGGLYYENKHLGELYAASAIVLNDHHEDMRREGFLNPRILDAYASGGFVISDYIEGIDSVFGDTLVRYKNPEHLRELVNYYISHPKERIENIEKGQDIVCRFTFSKMAEKILSDLHL